MLNNFGLVADTPVCTGLHATALGCRPWRVTEPRPLAIIWALATYRPATRMQCYAVDPESALNITSAFEPSASILFLELLGLFVPDRNSLAQMQAALQ